MASNAFLQKVYARDNITLKVYKLFFVDSSNQEEKAKEAQNLSKKIEPKADEPADKTEVIQTESKKRSYE